MSRRVIIVLWPWYNIMDKHPCMDDKNMINISNEMHNIFILYSLLVFSPLLLSLNFLISLSLTLSLSLLFSLRYYLEMSINLIPSISFRTELIMVYNELIRKLFLELEGNAREIERYREVEIG